jgi:hypothetical protein
MQAQVAYVKQEGGGDTSVCCIITKTKSYHEAVVKLYEEHMEELADVRSLLL